MSQLKECLKNKNPILDIFFIHPVKDCYLPAWMSIRWVSDGRKELALGVGSNPFKSRKKRNIFWIISLDLKMAFIHKCAEISQKKWLLIIGDILYYTTRFSNKTYSHKFSYNLSI